MLLHWCEVLHPSKRQINIPRSKHRGCSEKTTASILTSPALVKRIIDNKRRKPTHPLALLKTHLERPAAVGERRTHWGSPWGGRSWDSWHRAPHVSQSAPCSGCSSPQTSVVPSTERPAAQTVVKAKRSHFPKGIKLTTTQREARWQN